MKTCTDSMAAIKQCVACNRQIPESWNSCECGRVLTETRTIAGKRFSDYRAELYTRLVIKESKKQVRKTRVKRSRSVTQGRQREKTRLPNLLGGGKRRKRARPLLLGQEQITTAVQTLREDKQTQETTVPENASSAEPSRQTSKSFTSALAEINKRLQNQSKLWACLGSGLPLSANT